MVFKRLLILLESKASILLRLLVVLEDLCFIFLNINFQSKDQNIIAEYSVEGYTYCKGFWSGELEAHPCTWFSGLLVFGESVRANKNGKCTSLVSGTSYLVTDCVENVLLTFCNISCSDILNNLISNCCFS